MRDFNVIRRKNLMEAELVRAKNDMMCLNNQLLEAIQRKLELSQELEAWQVGALDVSSPSCIHAFITRGVKLRLKRDQPCVPAESPVIAIKLSYKESCGRGNTRMLRVSSQPQSQDLLAETPVRSSQTEQKQLSSLSVCRYLFR